MNSTIQTLWTVYDPETKKPTHNCFTASAIAAHLAAQNVENVYERNHYFAAPEEGTAFRKTIGDTFTIDPYQYPPPFLILPRLILAIGPDFFQARTYWFVLNVLVCGAAGAVLVAWLGGHARVLPDRAGTLRRSAFGIVFQLSTSTPGEWKGV